VALYVIPDPEVITSGEAQEVPTFGVFPVAVASTDRSADEWRKLIKDNHLHLVVADIRKITDAHRGTAVELAVKHGSAEETPPEENSADVPDAGAEGGEA
jgi:hypothetical protein